MSVPWWVIPPTVWALALLAAPSWGQISRRSRLRARGLDETQDPRLGTSLPQLAGTATCVSSSPPPPILPGGGLTVDAEPGYAPSYGGGLTPSVAAPGNSGASASFQYDGPGRACPSKTCGRGHWRSL